MILSILSGFIISILLLLWKDLSSPRLSLLLSLFPATLFIYFLSAIPLVSGGQGILLHYSWIPSMGISLDVRLDGLSLLFALLITGIGSLIYIYASYYLKEHPYLSRFYCYLSVFLASMLGLVLSDNLIALFVFWELTSISSFFLIGFDHDNKESRKSSLLALAVTGGGGFLLMAGFVLIGSVTGTYSITEIAAQNALLKESGFFGLILILVFAGAFTKSAQFPFHFWLPGAMKAPTPVSAYLHSATMVKAGIYIIARLSPTLGDHAFWNLTLMIVGGFTMLFAAFHTLFRTDLKSVLAYSTISVLGILVFLLGIGTRESFIAASVFILVHALYKAGLFMITGIIDHESGTRDLTVLSGLGKAMPMVAAAGWLAALSSAGVPFTIGFIGKDLIYESGLNSAYYPYILTFFALITNVLLLYAGFVAGIKPFLGTLPGTLKDVKAPDLRLWIPPLALGLCGILLGAFPEYADKSLLQSVARSINGSNVALSLKIWHGFNTVLILSITTLSVGTLMFFYLKPSAKRLAFINQFSKYSPMHYTGTLGVFALKFARFYTKNLQNGYLRSYILTILIFAILLLSFKIYTGFDIYINTSQVQQITLYEALVSVILILAILRTVTTPSRLVAVASMGVVGYCICLIFVFYSAPDLAMTQFTIDTLTVVLFVLVLFKLPPFLKLTHTAVKVRDAFVSIFFGGILSLIAIEVLNEKVTKETTQFYSQNSYLLAKGKNIVNVILVDFRGTDTLIEISVLSIAAIGVYSLLKLRVDSSEQKL